MTCIAVIDENISSDITNIITFLLLFSAFIPYILFEIK